MYFLSLLSHIRHNIFAEVFMVVGFLIMNLTSFLYIQKHSRPCENVCLISNIYLYNYETLCVCVSVCSHFLGHFVTDWETLWYKVSFTFRNGSKTIKFQKKLFFVELLPFFYISLRFLCKFDERLHQSPCFSIDPRSGITSKEQQFSVDAGFSFRSTSATGALREIKTSYRHAALSSRDVMFTCRG